MIIHIFISIIMLVASLKSYSLESLNKNIYYYNCIIGLNLYTSILDGIIIIFVEKRIFDYNKDLISDIWV